MARPVKGWPGPAPFGILWAVSGVKPGDVIAGKFRVERILVLHDEQLAAVPPHRYLTALDKLNRFAVEGLQSPIPPLAVGS